MLTEIFHFGFRNFVLSSKGSHHFVRLRNSFCFNQLEFITMPKKSQKKTVAQNDDIEDFIEVTTDKVSFFI